MKKLIVALVLVFYCPTRTIEAPLKLNNISRPKKADFISIYKSIRIWEGNYVYHPYDKGGETYGGMARKFTPEWKGWEHVDNYKKTQRKRILERNEYIESAEYYVQDWYLDVWIKEGFYNIQDQELAKILFDLRINSGKYLCIKLTQNALKRYGSDIVINKFDKEWVPAKDLNKLLNQRLIVMLIADERVKLYHRIVKNDRKQKVFLKGWMNRIENI